MQEIQKIIDLIDNAIKDDPELLLTGGNIIENGYDKKVDEYRDVLNNSRDWLANYQANLMEKTGITNLKIKYTNVSGYFIEIPKSQISKINNDFIHKQTLVNAARYITVELQEFEQKFNESQNFLASREYELFLEIRAEILDSFNEIKDLSNKTAFLDFEVSASNCAYLNNYSKPDISKSYDLDIIQARHPIIEQIESEFISNDLQLSKNNFFHIITGPNMGGKSTFLRQNALIILMAHIGYFVPAKKAEIPLTDKIFSRVGASDNLFLGQSTFMVEMQEIANILNNATANSFLIIDEIGRGTATYDGMSLAWAILKEIVGNIKAKTLFATHYHELTTKAKNLNAVENFSLAVSENENNLVFLRKVIKGTTNKSFGIEVAKLAGIKKSVLDEAKSMLLELQNKSQKNNQLNLGFYNEKENRSVEIVEKIIYKTKISELEKKLANININELTPMQALNFLNELKSVNN